MAIRVINDIIKIRDALFLHEIAEDIDVAIGFGIGSENVVVGDDDDFVFIPDFGILAELALENADGSRAADVVSHEDVGIDPDIVAGLNFWFARGTGKDFFSECHLTILQIRSHCSRMRGDAQEGGWEAVFSVLEAISKNQRKNRVEGLAGDGRLDV